MTTKTLLIKEKPQKEGKLRIIIMAMMVLVQSVFSSFVFASTGNKVVYFPNKREIWLFDLESETSRKIYEVKEKGFEIEFSLIKKLDGKLDVWVTNKENASFHNVIGSNFALEYQKGTVYQKEYLVHMNGKWDLLRIKEIMALDATTIEIQEKELLNKESPKIMMKREKNRRNAFVGPVTDEEASKNNINLITKNRCLFIRKNESDQELLINADKKVNKKIAYGCYNPSINNAGTKGLCSYFSLQSQKDDTNAILEIDLCTNKITRHNEIFGFNPSFSPDDKLILYKNFNQKHYEVFDIQKKTIVKLPKSEYALWVN